MQSFRSRTIEQEHGIAMLMTVIILLLISAIGISALQHSGDEAKSGGRSRHATRNLHAAEGMLILKRTQLENEDLAPIDIFQFLQDPITLDWTTARTGQPRSAVATPCTGEGIRKREGYMLNINQSGASAGHDRIVLCQVYATDAAGGVLQNQTTGGGVALEGQFAVPAESGGGGYR